MESHTRIVSVTEAQMIVDHLARVQLPYGPLGYVRYIRKRQTIDIVKNAGERR